MLKGVIEAFQKSDVDISLVEPIIHSAVSSSEAQLVTPGPFLARFLVTAHDKWKSIRNTN